MHKIIRSNRGLIKRNIDYLKENKFNNYNENFRKEYDEASFIDRMSLKKNLHFILDENKEVKGYVWLNNHKEIDTNIKSLFLKEESKEAFSSLSDFFDNYNKLEYTTSPESPCNDILEKVGFKQDKSIVDMEIELKEYKVDKYESYYVRRFKKRCDEWIRAEIQNAIFYSKNRTPLTVNDVELDMFQDYYLEDGSFFLTDNGKVIGYAQLILMDDELYMVNFGIVYTYRNKGLGKFFLKHVLNKAKSMGYDNLKIKVFQDNDVALKLYKGMGFREKRDTIYWIR